MSIGVVLYVEFPPGTNRSMAEERARSLLGDVAMSAPGSKVESHGVIATPLASDRTTFDALKREHLLRMNATHRLPTSPEVIGGPAPKQVLQWDAAGRRLKFGKDAATFSPKEFALLEAVRAGGGKPVRYADLYAEVIGGDSVGNQAQTAQISSLRNRTEAKIHRAFGRDLFDPFKKVWRLGMAWQMPDGVVILDA